jgi:hypothetical protein
MKSNKRSTDKKHIYIIAVITLGIMLTAIILLAGAANPASASDQTTNPSIEPSVLSTEPSKTPEITYITPSEAPAEPSPSPSEEPAPRYGFTDDDVYLLAQLLCGSKKVSGDGEYDIDFAKKVNYYEVSKVLCVVMNRVRSDKFPDTVYDVIMQHGQFAVMPANSKKTPSDIALQTVRDWCEAYDRFDPGVQVCPEDHLYFSGNGRINITR